MKLNKLYFVAACFASFSTADLVMTNNEKLAHDVGVMNVRLIDYFNVTLPWTPIRKKPNSTNVLLSDEINGKLLLYVLVPLYFVLLFLFLISSCCLKSRRSSALTVLTLMSCIFI